MAFKDQQDDDYVVGLVADRRGADIYLIAPVSCCGAQAESASTLSILVWTGREERGALRGPVDGRADLEGGGRAAGA